MTTIDTFLPEKWIHSYIPGASNLDSTNLQPILYFTLLWNLFETVTCQRNADFKKIKQDVKIASEGNLLSLEKIQDVQDFFSNLYSGLDEADLRDKLLSSEAKPNLSCDAIKNLHNFLNKVDISAESVFNALLFIAYRVRNNLFHGEKKINNLYNQKELFQALNKLLADYLSQAHANYEG